MKPKFIKIILAIVIIFIVAGYLFLTGKTGQKEESTEKVANNTVSTAETADWKTYKNEEYGFEFKYPKEYFISLPSYETANEATGGFDPDTQEEILNEDLIFDNIKSITVWVWVNRIDSLLIESTREKDDPLQDTTQKDLIVQRAEIENSKTFNGSYFAKNKNSVTKTIKIGDKKLKRSIWYSHQSGLFVNDLEFFSKNGDLITIQSFLFGVKNIEEAKKDPQTNIFDTIVYSFKDTHSENEGYKNRYKEDKEKYGFEFKEPSEHSVNISVVDFAKSPDTVKDACDKEGVLAENWETENDCDAMREFAKEELVAWKKWIENEKTGLVISENDITKLDYSVRETIMEEIVEINGIKMLKGSYRSTQSSIAFIGAKLFTKNGDLIILQSGYYPSNEKIQKGIEMTKQEIMQDKLNSAFEQALSTFKFTE